MGLFKKIAFKNLIIRFKLGSHKNAIPLFIVSLIGSLLPMLIGVLFLVRKGEGVDWKLFYIKGEFYLYSAAFLTSAGYIFYSFKDKNYDIYSILCLVTGILIFFDSILYAFIVSDNEHTEFYFLKWTSIFFLIFSIIFFYIASYMNIKNFDLMKAEADAIQKIKNQLP